MSIIRQTVCDVKDISEINSQFHHLINNLCFNNEQFLFNTIVDVLKNNYNESSLPLFTTKKDHDKKKYIKNDEDKKIHDEKNDNGNDNLNGKGVKIINDNNYLKLYF